MIRTRSARKLSPKLGELFHFWRQYYLFREGGIIRIESPLPEVSFTEVDFSKQNNVWGTFFNGIKTSERKLTEFEGKIFEGQQGSVITPIILSLQNFLEELFSCGFARLHIEVATRSEFYITSEGLVMASGFTMTDSARTNLIEGETFSPVSIYDLGRAIRDKIKERR